MNKLISFVKSLRLNQVLTAFLAGVLLLLSTACDRAEARDAKISDRGPNPPGQVQPYEGGMNNFSDVDTSRVNTKPIKDQAKALKDRVERNLDEKRIDSVDQYVENYRTGTPLGERTERFAKDIKRGVENFGEDAQDITERSADKVQRSIDKAPTALDRTTTKRAGQ